MPVTLSAAATLQVNKAYTITGSGYALTLPDAAANIGAVLFVLIHKAATGLFALNGTAYSLYARESLTLRAGPNGWTKTGGELLPLSARIETRLDQQDVVNDTFKIPFSVVVTNSLTMADIANSRLVLPRDGFYTLGAAGVLKNCTVNGQYVFYFKATAPDGSISYPSQAGAVTENAENTGTCTLVAPTSRYLAGTTIEALFYARSTANLRGQYTGNQFFLSASESV